MTTNAALFEPLKLNDSITLKNRIVMAPLTRCFADDNLVPTELSVDYYRRRADAGLIVTEATIISPMAQGYPNTPGIFNEAQIAGWKKVTDAVHQENGKIFSQIWHVGRTSHPFYLNGETPVAPSAVKLEGRVPRTEDLEYGTPRALTLEEIDGVIADFVAAAKNALEAGFDGVEIHGANGYLLDQFLHQETNLREDKYGGTVEKRAAIVLEVVDAIVNAVGADKVGIRLSPHAYFNLAPVKGDEETFVYLIDRLNSAGLAYIHVGMFDDTQPIDYLDGRVCEFIRKHYNGNILGCGAYDASSAETDVKNGVVNFVAFGRDFIANPDLVEKLRTSAELTNYDEAMLAELV